MFATGFVGHHAWDLVAFDGLVFVLFHRINLQSGFSCVGNGVVVLLGLKVVVSVVKSSDDVVVLVDVVSVVVVV